MVLPPAAFLTAWQDKAKPYVVNGTACGVVYGTHKGVREATAAGLAGRAFARSVAKRTVLTGVGWASFFAVYTATVAGIERARNDAGPNLAHSLAAGTVTGCVMALRTTRNPPVVALSGALSGALCLAIDAAGLAVQRVTKPQGRVQTSSRAGQHDL